jgi:hypothetical protein
MGLASALGAVDAGVRWDLGVALAATAGKDRDPNLHRLIWAGWGVEVERRPRDALELAPTLPSSEPSVQGLKNTTIMLSILLIQ